LTFPVHHFRQIRSHGIYISCVAYWHITLNHMQVFIAPRDNLLFVTNSILTYSASYFTQSTSCITHPMLLLRLSSPVLNRVFPCNPACFLHGDHQVASLPDPCRCNKRAKIPTPRHTRSSSPPRRESPLEGVRLQMH
jgi:hypothetical protein